MLIKTLAAVDTAIGKVSTFGLLISLILMIGLTILNIVLRWFDMTLLWIEPLVRQLVFLCAFLGGAVATGSKNHIAIDLASRLMEAFQLEKLRVWLDRLISLFCLLGLIWLIYAGYLLVLVEQQYGQEKFLGIHSSVLAGIIPAGLALIAYRFFYLLVLSFASDSSDGKHASV